MIERILVVGLWFVLLAVASVGSAGPGAPTVHAPVELNLMPPVPRASALDAEARHAGRLRVIVRLHQDLLDAETDAVAGSLGRQAGTGANRPFKRLGMRRLESRLMRELGAGMVLKRRYSELPFLVAEVDLAGLARLRASDLVADVVKDSLVTPALAQSVPLIGATQAHLGGFTGAGQLIAVLDTGVLTTHGYFTGRVRTDLEACFSIPPESGDISLCPGGAGYRTCLDSSQQPVEGSVCGPGAAAVDKCVGANGCDHGTHVSGIALGSPGVAPGAGLVPVQVFFRRGGSLYAQSSDIMSALDYVLGLRESGEPIAAVNMSLGGDLYASTRLCDSDAAAEKQIVDRLRSVGVATGGGSTL